MINRITRPRVRYIAAALAAAAAVLYFLIGIGVLRVVDASSATPDLFEFGAMTGGAFAIGALLLAITDRRLLWYMGALVQMVVLVGYMFAADMRTPAFEFWGLALKAIQLVLLVALVYLAVKPYTSQLSRTTGALPQSA
jgi:hypothetical protein